LNSFKKMASTFKKHYFPDELFLTDPVKVEELYWKIVNEGEEFVRVHYGSDLPVGTYGSGFQRDSDLKSASWWNLNKFPRAPGSLLSHISDDIAGVIQPML